MLQIIAMLTMFIDHVGYFLIDRNELFRVIGRIAFPLYAYFVVMGYLYTKNLTNYWFRLFWIALISEVIFILTLDFPGYNAIFTLLLGLTAIIGVEKLNKKIHQISFVFLILVLATFIPVDYGVYGVMSVLMYFMFQQPLKLLIAHVLLNAAFIAILEQPLIQMFSLIATLLILFQKYYPEIQVNKMFYQSFYPAHVVFIFIWAVLL